jgi:DeoR family transcriptional regulator of aga operon
MNDKLFLEERLNRIIALVEAHERVSVAELCQRFMVSPVTIRNDLATLESQGYLTRTHGGAMARSSVGVGVVPAFAFRQRLHAVEKERIGQAAARQVRDGEAIALDDSTTSWHVAQYLKDRHELTVVTNGLYCALELLESPGVTVVLVGGTLRTASASLVGDEGAGILDRYHIRMGFFGARGLTVAEGLTDPDPYGAEMKRCMVARSREVVAIVDSSKWNQVAFATFASLEQVHQVITDACAPADTVAAMRELGIIVTIV